MPRRRRGEAWVGEQAVAIDRWRGRQGFGRGRDGRRRDRRRYWQITLDLTNHLG